MPSPRSRTCSHDCVSDHDQEDDASYPNEADALFDTDSFKMYCFKILPCAKRNVHDWTSCPFAHPGEKARRRDPRVYSYLAIPCPDVKHNRPCKSGDNCPYAHSVFEYWLHPSRYRTQLCQHGTNCKRGICFFAHTPSDLRVPDHSHLDTEDVAAPTTAPRSTSGSVKSSNGSTTGSDSLRRRGSSSSGSSSSSTLSSPTRAHTSQARVQQLHQQQLATQHQQAEQQLATQHQQELQLAQQQQLAAQQAQQQEQQRALHHAQAQQLHQQQQREVFGLQQSQHEAQQASSRSPSPTFHLGELLSALPPVQSGLPLSPNSCMLDEIVMPPTTLQQATSQLAHHCSPPLSPTTLSTASPTSVLHNTFNVAPAHTALRPGLLPASADYAMLGSGAAYGSANECLPTPAMLPLGGNGCGAAASLAGGLSMDDVAQLVSMAQQDSGAGGNQLLLGLVNVLVHQLQQQQVMV